MWSNKHTVKELKEGCRAAGLPVSGNKQTLLDRLHDHTAKNSTTATSTSSSTATTSTKRPLEQTAEERARQQQIEQERVRQLIAQQQAQHQARIAAQQAAREAAIIQAAQDRAEAKAVEEGMNSFYRRYDDAEYPGEIRDEGIQKLGEDMGVDIMSDVVFLALLHKMAPQMPGRITREEFTKGMQLLKCSSVAKLKALKASLDPGFLTQTEFKELYRFIFHFNRETRDIKNIPKEIVTALLPIAIGDNRCGSEHVKDFVEFLEAHDEIKQVNMDGWMGFLEFSTTVGKNFEGHDAEGAWPVLIDDFVEYKQGKLKNGMKNLKI